MKLMFLETDNCEGKSFISEVIGKPSLILNIKSDVKSGKEFGYPHGEKVSKSGNMYYSKDSTSKN